MRSLRQLLPFFCVIPLQVFGFQSLDSTLVSRGKVHVAPGERYETSWLGSLFLGTHWRALWSTAIEADVLDLEHSAGGLTPIKRGGTGRETKSLTFRGKDGKEYKFRSIDKDPKKLLPPELQESIATDLLQDQISSSNPLAPIVVAPLLNAVGVLNAEPRVVVLPDDKRLGEFRQDYGLLLGTFQEKPKGGTDDEPGFAGADKTVRTFTLFRRLEENHNEREDAAEFLKARLMDIYLGD